MRHCIPDELFNLIPYPTYGLNQVGLDAMFREVRYKLPMAADVMIRKELWHSTCDFCRRTGGLLDRRTGSGGSCAVSSSYGRFIRLVGAGTTSGETASVRVDDNLERVFFESDESNYIIFSVQPKFSNDDTVYESGVAKWKPTLPEWFVEKNGECIVHGALARLFAMGNKPWAETTQARMHAIAYNNDMNRLSFGLITSGMRKDMLIDVEDWIKNNPYVIRENGNG